MTNDLTTVDGSFQQLIDDLENNLQSMGVTDAEFDSTTGIRGLASKILDIEPSVAEMELSTSIELTRTNFENFIGQPIEVQAKLKVEYDDTTAANIDVSGVLTGATVKFMNGNTLLGTSITNNEGIATYTHTFDTQNSGINFTAVFEGSENFDSCTSEQGLIRARTHVSFDEVSNIISSGEILLLADLYDEKYNDIPSSEWDGNEYWIAYDKNGELIEITAGSETSYNPHGTELLYTGQGIGDVTIYRCLKLKDGNLLQETYELYDCYFYDSGITGTPNTDWWKTNNTLTLTSDNTGLTASNTGTTTLYLSPNRKGTSTGSIANLVDWNDFICEFTFHEFTNTNSLMLETRDSNGSLNQRYLTSMSLTDGDVIRMEYSNNVCKVFKNNVQFGNDLTNCSGDVMIRLAIKENSIRFSNFKIYSA